MRTFWRWKTSSVAAVRNSRIALEIETNQPRLTASAEFDKYDVPRGGIAQVKVSVTRGGFDAPVTVRVADAPDVLSIGSVAAGKPDGIVTLVFPPNFEPGKLLNLRLVAESTVDKKPVTCDVSNAAALRKSLGGIPTPPPSLEGFVAVGVTPPSDAQFVLTTKAAGDRLGSRQDEGRVRRRR